MPKVLACGCSAAASAVTAGVRMAVSQVQSMTAMGTPVTISFMICRPVVCGRP